MSHRNMQPHVSIHVVACYRTERTLMGCALPATFLRGVSKVPPPSVFREFMKNGVVGGVVTGSTCFEMRHHVTAITHTSACSMLRHPTTSTKRNKSLRPPPVVQLTVSLRDQIEITLDNRAPKNRGGVSKRKKERKKERKRKQLHAVI